MSFQIKKQQFIDFCLQNDKKITKNNLPKIKLNQKKETIFIEFRLLPHTSFIIKNTILKLGMNGLILLYVEIIIINSIKI